MKQPIKVETAFDDKFLSAANTLKQ
jgi:hypothetical protein